jgi:hypothetical protein
MKVTTFACALLAGLALQGCDRRQSDGHSTIPPEQGAATEAPAEAPADQSVQPAEPPPAAEPATEPARGEDDGR